MIRGLGPIFFLFLLLLLSKVNVSLRGCGGVDPIFFSSSLPMSKLEGYEPIWISFFLVRPLLRKGNGVTLSFFFFFFCIVRYPFFFFP